MGTATPRAQKADLFNAKISAGKAAGGPATPALETLMMRHAALRMLSQDKQRRLGALKEQLALIEEKGAFAGKTNVANLRGKVSAVDQERSVAEAELENLEAVIAALLLREEDELRKKQEMQAKKQPEVPAKQKQGPTQQGKDQAAPKAVRQLAPQPRPRFGLSNLSRTMRAYALLKAAEATQESPVGLRAQTPVPSARAMVVHDSAQPHYALSMPGRPAALVGFVPGMGRGSSGAKAGAAPAAAGPK